MSRPLVRYHGGKWKLAPWIISHIPKHRTYTEAFGGGGSVLLRKPRSYAEVYNDLDGEIVNLFRVARNRGVELERAVRLTPFAREEFVESYLPSECELEQARRTLIRSFMGFGSAAVSKQVTGFRANSNRSGTTPAHDWANYPKALELTIARLQGVVIENRDAIDVLKQHDNEHALHYVDPPYVLDTRWLKDKTKAYKHEMTDADHERLAQVLLELEGGVILSGYRCELYDTLYKGWRRIDRAAHADGAADRVESLWISPTTAQNQASLLEAA
jgi:DNA adenine methylase